MYFIAEELREYMAKLGFRTIEEMVGRFDRLKEKESKKKFPRGIFLILKIEDAVIKKLKISTIKRLVATYDFLRTIN